MKSLLEQKAIVLMYHRIADTEIDPWQLSVSPKNFEEQLQVMQKLNLVPVKKLVSDVCRKSIKAKTVCVTFDDGYMDNHTTAKPLLEKYNTPATFFITSDAIGKDKQFWWDELDSILLHTQHLPLKLSIKIKEDLLDFDLPSLSNEEFELQKKWVYPDEPPTKQSKAYLKIWERLRPLQIQEINKTLQELQQWANDETPVHTGSSGMSFEQLESIEGHSLITLEAHTVTHPALGNHSYQVQQEEIKCSRDFLESRSYTPVSTISYPYGNYNKDTLQIVKGNRFLAGFTTEEQTVTNKSDRYELGRFQVNNWNGDQFEEQLFKWLKYN